MTPPHSQSQRMSPGLNFFLAHPSCNEICALGRVKMSVCGKKTSFTNVNVKKEVCSRSVVPALGGNMQMA